MVIILYLGKGFKSNPSVTAVIQYITVKVMASVCLPLTKHHTMQTYSAEIKNAWSCASFMRDRRHSSVQFLTSALNGSQQSASCLSFFSSKEKVLAPNG
jgi:hypothetical protein